jgi:hypothetical protein
MQERSRKHFSDVNSLAASIVGQTISQSAHPPHEKNPAAVALGRLGGLKGGRARADKLSAKRRSEIAKGAANKRWGTNYH